MNNDLDFEYGSGTEARYGCGVSIKGQFWYLGGGGSKNRQVRTNQEKLFATDLHLGKQNYWL